MHVRGCTVIVGSVVLSMATAAHAQFELPKIKPPKIGLPDLKAPKKETEKEGPQSVECPKFESVKAHQQENVWCWAACAEMIYRYHKKTIEQKEIAARIHGFTDKGEAQVKAASLYEIMIALADVSGESDRARRFAERFGEQVAKNPKKGVTLDVGKYLSAWGSEEAVDTDDLVEQLRKHEPLVVGMTRDDRFEGGHAMVVYGATFKLADASVIRRTIDANDKEGLTKPLDVRRFEIITLKVMDPWTGEPREISKETLAKDGDFLMSQKRARAILKKEDESIR